VVDPLPGRVIPPLDGRVVPDGRTVPEPGLVMDDDAGAGAGRGVATAGAGVGTGVGAGATAGSGSTAAIVPSQKPSSTHSKPHSVQFRDSMES
jgi:hypothetical protein